VAVGRAAQRAANIVHPNAVQTFEMALLGRSHVAVVMELVEGTTLERLVRGHAVRGRRMPLDLALFVTLEIAEALSGARMATTPEGVHAGTAHLGVSAHQVLLSFHGEVKLADFGFAQVAPWGSAVRRAREAAQRWAPVAPEVARGQGGDARSDVFSLGVLFREMLVGPRFGADANEGDVARLAQEGVVAPTFLEVQLPPGVSEILHRALSKDPRRRQAHATALAYELRRVALSMGVGDGRVFLRATIADQATTASLPPPPVEPPPDPDTQDDLKAVDDPEAARVPEDRTSGLILRADRSTKRGA
jgi:serine/threonine protein kinase